MTASFVLGRARLQKEAGVGSALSKSLSKLISFPGKIVERGVRTPIDLLFGSPGKGRYAGKYLIPRKNSKLAPVGFGEANVLRIGGRGDELVKTEKGLFRKIKRPGGLAGVAYDHPLAAAIVGGGGYLLAKSPKSRDRQVVVNAGQQMPMMPYGSMPGMRL
jgi:hypothetical protein